MTKSIFEKITLDTSADEALKYAHSSEYAKKRVSSAKNLPTVLSIRKKKTILKKLLG